MKLIHTFAPFACLTALVLGAPALLAEERTERFDAESARETLSKEVKQPKFFTKSVDPVSSRFYTKDAVVITRASGAKVEQPYVPVPLQFKVNTDQLFDATSRQNVLKLAQLIKDLGAKSEQFAVAIEGHASAEGEAQRNEELSKLRAQRIQELLREQGVSANVIARVQGFGSKHAQHPATAPDSQRQQDRRVLVVREK
jgi:outer membrane protein OmpA-like peptidoglycan-associated protein